MDIYLLFRKKSLLNDSGAKYGRDVHLARKGYPACCIIRVCVYKTKLP